MSLKVAKFGGSSLADAAHFENAANIIKADRARRYIVVSAPGKRSPSDTKITDLLLESLSSAHRDPIIETVAERFRDIIRELGLKLSIEDDVAQMKKAARLGLRDFLISRGEYLSAKIMAAFLGYDFIDACEGVFFDAPYRCNRAETQKRMGQLLKKSRYAVIPGFYGADPNGNICTFLRGGSDITGAIVASAVGADVYENWTDVSGVLAADPRITPNPQPIQAITYEQLRTFAHLGAQVLHEDAIAPCKQSGIPILIKNTNRPMDKGTMVVSGHPGSFSSAPVAIGVKKDMSMISARIQGRNAQVQSQIRQLLCASGVSPEHLSVTAERITLIAPGDRVKNHEQALMDAMSSLEGVDRIAVKQDLAMIGVIGSACKRAEKTKQAAAEALLQAEICTDFLDIGSERSCIIAVVEKLQSTKAVNALYKALIQGQDIPSGTELKRNPAPQPA